MILQEGQVFRCVNPVCAAELKVTSSSIEGDFAIKCCCGSVMKKRYSKPVLRIISENDPAARVFLASTEALHHAVEHRSDREGSASSLC